MGLYLRLVVGRIWSLLSIIQPSVRTYVFWLFHKEYLCEFFALPWLPCRSSAKSCFKNESELRKNINIVSKYNNLPQFRRTAR